MSDPIAEIVIPINAKTSKILIIYFELKCKGKVFAEMRRMGGFEDMRMPALSLPKGEDVEM
jgi:hypothetical protein